MRIEEMAKKLQTAKDAIAKAEAELQDALAQVRVAPRAEKIAISQVLEHAVARVHAARVEVTDLETSLHDVEL